MKNLKIGIRLAIGFASVLILTIIVSVIAIIEMQNLAENIVQMYKHPLAVSNAVRDIRADIIAIHRSMKDVALAKDVGQITTASATVYRYEQKVYKSFELVSQRFLGDKSDVKTAKQAFSEWKAIRDEVIRLMELGEKDQAAEITKGKGAKHVEDMDKKIQVMIDFASDKGNSFFEKAQQDSQWAIFIMIILLIVTFITSVVVAIVITLSIVTPLNQIVKKIRNVATGDLSQEIEISRHDEMGELARSTYTMIKTLANVVVQTDKIAKGDYKADIAPRSEKDKLGIALQKMTKTLSEISAENQQKNWLKTGQTELNEAMRGDMDVIALARKVITYVSKYLEVQVGTLYLYDEENQALRLKASYAYNHRKGLNNVFKLGDGLVGQAAIELEMLIVTDMPEDYIQIISGTGYTAPRNIIVAPIVYENVLKAVIELASLKPFSDNSQQFLATVTENIAISITSAQSRVKMNALLAKSQQQTEELTAQQEELRATNEELEERTQALENNEIELKSKQAALENSNVVLEEQTKILQMNETSLRQQKEDLQLANSQLDQTRQEIETKARELEISSRYKSEFLANMSHELRTPLNSMLILSQQLADNEEENLTDEQIESSKIIYNGGQDLLNLINEILDLSKIEAGKMTIDIQTVPLAEITSILKTNFKPLADKKDLALHINIAPDLPASIETDEQRLAQILKNLLSNAFKFTKKGSITLDFQPVDAKADLSRSGLDPQQAIAMAVIDTGIGIQEEKQLKIFEAFQQADGTTSRQYGGTGLGLSISRELAKLLGGELQLSSVEKEGSTFTLYLPLDAAAKRNRVSSRNSVSEDEERNPISSKDSVSEDEERNRVSSRNSVSKPSKQVPILLPSQKVETPAPPNIDDDRDNLEDNDRILS